MNRFVPAALAAAALAAPVAAQDITVDAEGRAKFESVVLAFDQTERFGQWDQDGDGLLSPPEFRAGVAATGLGASARFETWDLNGNGMLSTDEVHQSLFVLYDSDVDDELTSAEARALANDWGMGIKVADAPDTDTEPEPDDAENAEDAEPESDPG